MRKYDSDFKKWIETGTKTIKEVEKTELQYNSTPMKTITELPFGIMKDIYRIITFSL